jgi:hypothetical protein
MLHTTIPASRLAICSSFQLGRAASSAYSRNAMSDASSESLLISESILHTVLIAAIAGRRMVQCILKVVILI